VSPADHLTGLDFVTEATARERAAKVDEPAWLLADRLDAVRRFESLPVEPNRLFTTYLDLRQVHFGDLTPYAEVADDGAAAAASLPAGASAFLHIRDGAVVGRALSAQARAAGVVVDTFANVLRSHPALLGEILEGARTLPDDDIFAQLARATYAVGAVVHVPPGVQLREPIVVRWSVGAAGRALVTRTVIHLGKGAQARLLEEQRSSLDGAMRATRAAADDRQSLWSGTCEVLLDEGATLEVAAEQDLGPDTSSFITRQAAIGEAATLTWALAHVGGLLVRSRVDNLLVGRAGTVRQAEIGFGGGAQTFDLTSYTHHIGRDTTGDLLSKGIFQDRSRGFFKGLIDIQRTAVGTDSFLGEFAMLLDRKARSVAVPSLEIDQPDVRRAMHSSSVGPIDENQLFYLETRGLPADLARKSIVLSFLEPVVARIPLPEAQDRLRELLDRKWDAGRTALAA
jgi:Fe-S cluster assembly protein SufD